MKLSWRQIEAFRAIMRTGSITLAADVMAVTQPAVSTLLYNLEGSLGYKLFIREKGRLVATKEADALFVEVERSFFGLEEIVSSARSIGQMQRGILRVVVVPAFAGSFIADVAASFMSAHDDISLVIELQPRLTALNWLVTDRCDIAITNEPAESSEIETVVLSMDEAICLLPRTHALSKNQVITAADLHGQKLICLPAGSRTSRRLETLLEDAGSIPFRRIRCRSTKTIWDLVDRGLGVSVVTNFSLEVNEAKNVITLPFEPTIQTGVCLATSRNHPISLLANEFRTHCLNEAKKQNQ